MRSPLSPLQLFLVIALLLFLVILVQIEILSLVLTKLGLSAESAVALFMVMLIGSGINLPLFSLYADKTEQSSPRKMPLWIAGKMPPYEGRTLITINVGGALIPSTFSFYLILIKELPLISVSIAIMIVSVICYIFSRPIKGLGIGMPIFIAPVSAALTAILILPEHSAPLAYVCGTLGVLIGADILRLKDIPALATPIASIGGAGTFDGIFFTGIIAVLLA